MQKAQNNIKALQKQKNIKNIAKSKTYKIKLSKYHFLFLVVIN